jgi:sulfur carrier protein
MDIRVNGEPRAFAGEPALAALLFELGIEPGQPGVAVALNARVIPGREIASTPLADGDRVEIVRAVQGG